MNTYYSCILQNTSLYTCVCIIGVVFCDRQSVTVTVTASAFRRTTVLRSTLHATWLGASQACRAVWGVTWAPLRVAERTNVVRMRLRASRALEVSSLLFKCGNQIIEMVNRKALVKLHVMNHVVQQFIANTGLRKKPPNICTCTCMYAVWQIFCTFTYIHASYSQLDQSCFRSFPHIYLHCPCTGIWS